MNLPVSRATAIAAMLSSALGVPMNRDDPVGVRTEAHGTSIRVTVPVAGTHSEGIRLGVLAFLLRTADRFGHSVRSNGTAVIWADVRSGDGPAVVPDALSIVVPDAGSNTELDAGPNAELDARPIAVPNAVPDAASNGVPDYVPDVMADVVVPDVGPDAVPDAVTDVVPDAVRGEAP
ncbi:hypothetical protein ACIQNG_18720 [Streptomyces sp. NPDC091377]|uniref:hypothetical protein n=1 Tax=Streptomyces sp. NPDC091377 TaxID=3365995 RepID=UPI0037FE47B3